MVGLVTEQFAGFARELLAQRNAGSLPLAVVQHPVGGIRREEAAARITDDVIVAVVAALQNAPAEPRS
ncbi:MAG: hypothetical protein HY899_11300 [Deltaproteobacteria bacterium]|nr:hypothetical protein [Deltaproteobacteria bacterium]